MPVRLKDLSVVQVDLVDIPANKKKFLVIKSENREEIGMPTLIKKDEIPATPSADTGLSVEAKVLETLDSIKTSLEGILKKADTTEEKIDFSFITDSVKGLQSKMVELSDQFKLSFEAKSTEVITPEVKNETPVIPNVSVNVDLSPLKELFESFTKSIDEKIGVVSKRIDDVETGSAPVRKSIDGQDISDDENPKSVFKGLFNYSA